MQLLYWSSNWHSDFRKYTDPHDDQHDPLFLVATLLDPRFKLLLNKQQITSARDELLKELSDNGSPTGSGATSSPIYPETEEPPAKQFCHLSKLIGKRWKEIQKRATMRRPGEQEVERYLSISATFRDLTDPLVFWIEHQNKLSIALFCCYCNTQILCSNWTCIFSSRNCYEW